MNLTARASSNRTDIRAMQRASAKRNSKEIQRQMGIPKSFIQHARRHGLDAQDIAQTHAKHRRAPSIDRTNYPVAALIWA